VNCESGNLKKEIESALARRFESSFEPRGKFSFETLTTGIAEIETLSNGLPRGAITEIAGATSSGEPVFCFRFGAGDLG